MAQNYVKNGGFEADWGEEKSHRVLIFPEGAEPYEKEVGNIFTPPKWTTWFRHDPGTWDQPEVRDAWKEHDPRRVHGGQKGMLLFTFFRRHDAGFLQRVEVAPGTRLRLTAWAHAWSNHAGAEDGGHPDDGRWSDGAGYDVVAWPASDNLPHDTGDPQTDAKPNFTFWVGIDPNGGSDPLSNDVIWGEGYHIYNGYCQELSVEATAQSNAVTVFLRSQTLWSFKHSDAYWDDAELVAVGGDGDDHQEPPQVELSYNPAHPQVGQPVKIDVRSKSMLAGIQVSVRQPSGALLPLSPTATGGDGGQHTWVFTTSPLKEAGTHTIALSASGGAQATSTFGAARPAPAARGLPREQYTRTYVLLPPQADAAWALAAVDGSWDRHKYTIGGSADDAGIGDLNVRRVIAVNPQQWPTDLRSFFAEHYPGVEYTPVTANSPDELRQRLSQL